MAAKADQWPVTLGPRAVVLAQSLGKRGLKFDGRVVHGSAQALGRLATKLDGAGAIGRRAARSLRTQSAEHFWLVAKLSPSTGKLMIDGIDLIIGPKHALTFEEGRPVMPVVVEEDRSARYGKPVRRAA